MNHSTFTTLRALALTFVVSLPLPQASASPHSDEAPTTKASSGAKVIKRGSALPKGEVISLDAVAKDPESFSGKRVLVTGTISAVCQAKGCWMTLAGSEPTARARVTFKDYAFFVPKNGKGMKAVLEAEVKIKMMSDAERQHLAEDGKVSVDQIPKVELRLVASGLELSAQ